MEKEIDLLMQDFLESLQSQDIKIYQGHWLDAISYKVLSSDVATTAVVTNPPLAGRDKFTSSDISLELIDGQLGDQIRSSLRVKVRLLYHPSRIADETTKYLHIFSNGSGARWTYPIKITAIPPAIDDSIAIEGTVGQPNIVSFDINSSAGRERKFRAYFVKETPQFNVRPESGMLVSNGPNRFYVKYHPKVYGKTMVNMLKIEVAHGGDNLIFAY